DQLAAAREANVLVPQVVYGYWLANGDGNDLVVWANRSRDRELARFTFPRQSEDPYLCIADFFRPVEAGELDYAAFHVVTMGEEFQFHPEQTTSAIICHHPQAKYFVAG